MTYFHKHKILQSVLFVYNQSLIIKNFPTTTFFTSLFKRNIITYTPLNHLRFRKMSLHSRRKEQIVPHTTTHTETEIIPTIFLIYVISVKHRTICAIFRINLWLILIAQRIPKIYTPIK